MCKRDGIDLYNYVPLTFSFRTNEPAFFDDLQNFAKLFLAIEKGVSADAIKSKDTYTDKYQRVHQVYYNFDIITPNKPSCQQGRFYNLPANQVKIPQSFDAGRNLWILKPSCMSRGRGLEIFSNLDQLSEFLKMYMSGYDAKDYKEMKYSDKTTLSPSQSSESNPPLTKNSP